MLARRHSRTVYPSTCYKYQDTSITSSSAALYQAAAIAGLSKGLNMTSTSLN